MELDEPKNKRSIAKLRIAGKTREKSPDMTGTLRLQRHTAVAILKQFEDSDCDEVECNIAGWVNVDRQGKYLTVEISPKYVAREWRSPKNNDLAFIFNSEEDHS
jgi:hypothetical protein